MLLSETTSAIVAGDLPDGVRMRSVGDQVLRDIERPEPLHELQIDDVPATPVTDSVEPTLPDGPAPAIRLPEWLGASVGQIGARTGDLIEQRVLAELNSAFTAETSAPASIERPPPSPPGGSVADEIAKLQDLRDAGALSDEQYVRAVDRAIDGSGE